MSIFGVSGLGSFKFSFVKEDSLIEAVLLFTICCISSMDVSLNFVLVSFELHVRVNSSLRDFRIFLRACVGEILRLVIGDWLSGFGDGRSLIFCCILWRRIERDSLSKEDEYFHYKFCHVTFVSPIRSTKLLYLSLKPDPSLPNGLPLHWANMGTFPGFPVSRHPILLFFHRTFSRT